jgi:hypothetical protein
MAAFIVFIIFAGFCLALVSAIIAVFIHKIFPVMSKFVKVVISGLLPAAALCAWLLRWRMTIVEQIHSDSHLWFRHHFGEGISIVWGVGHALVVVSAIFGLIASFYILNRSS